MAIPAPDESMKKINEIILGYNKDIDNEKTRLVNVNTRLKDVANAIGTFATSGGAAVEEINKQIEKVTKEAEEKKGKAANDVKDALGKIDFTELKKTIGMIGAVSVEIKAVARICDAGAGFRWSGRGTTRGFAKGVHVGTVGRHADWHRPGLSCRWGMECTHHRR